MRERESEREKSTPISSVVATFKVPAQLSAFWMNLHMSGLQDAKPASQQQWKINQSAELTKGCKQRKRNVFRVSNGYYL
jgi:hypothetical protein